MEKLWNLSKTAVPMEKLWNFRFGGKKCVLSLKNRGKIYPDFNMWFQRLLLQLSLHQAQLYEPPGLQRQPRPSEYLLGSKHCSSPKSATTASSYVILTQEMIIFSFSVKTSQSRCPRPHKVRAQVTDSHNLSLFFLRPPSSIFFCPSPGIHVIWLCKLCHSTYSAPSFSLGSRSRFN